MNGSLARISNESSAPYSRTITKYRQSPIGEAGFKPSPQNASAISNTFN